MQQRNVSNNKVIFHLDNIKNIKEKNIFAPICFEIHPTNYCTHNCMNCISQTNRKEHSDIINGAALIDALKKFRDNGCKSILWSGGGDPLLYHCTKTKIRINDIILYANKIGLKQGVYTNGEYFDDELIKTILSSCTFLRFSLDSFSHKTHKRVHRSNSYNKIIDNLNRCVKLKKQLNSSIDIGASYVVYDNNIKDIFCSANKWLKANTIDYVYFKPGTFKKNSIITKFKQRIAFRYLLTKKKSSKTFANIEIAQIKFNNLLKGHEHKNRKVCYVPMIFPTLTANSSLYYCCHMVYSKEFLIGNLANIDNIYSNFIYNEDLDFSKCPINCRGHIINRDIEYAIQMLDNKHIDFL